MHVICQLALSSNYTALRYIARKCVTKFMFALSASYTTFFIFFITSHCKAMGTSRFHNTNEDFLCNYWKKMLNDFQYLIKKCLVCL